MFPLFDSLKNLIKFRAINNDNVAFQLHYKFTVAVLAACCIAISTRQFLGDPIHCTLPGDDIGSGIIDSYCWIHATFTLPGTVNHAIDSQVPHPGVDKLDPGDDVQYHAYYQWVCFVLLLQCVMFYVPRWLWKNWEGGRIAHLMLDLNKPVDARDNRKSNRTKLSDYIFQTFKLNDQYAYKYFLCEILNFVNVVGQIYFVNRFLDGEFTTYGSDVISFMNTDQEYRGDPMIRVFPRVTKCTFRRFGPSGDIQRHDSLCVLPLNIINEKIYVFLWFWFIIVALTSSLALLYRLVVVLIPGIRTQLMKSKLNHPKAKEVAHKILRRGSLGDWFLLYMLGKNMNPLNFKNLIFDVERLIDEEDGKLQRKQEESIA